MDPRHFQQSQTAWQQGSEHPAGLQLLPHPPYAPQPCFLSPLQQQHYGLMIPFPQQQTDLQQLLQHQQQQSQHFSQAHGSVPEGPWRAGRGRGGRGRGNHVVAALIATFADPHSKTKYDECDPEVVEGLWGAASGAGTETGTGGAAEAPQGKAAPGNVSASAGAPTAVATAATSGPGEGVCPVGRHPQGPWAAGLQPGELGGAAAVAAVAPVMPAGQGEEDWLPEAGTQATPTTQATKAAPAPLVQEDGSAAASISPPASAQEEGEGAAVAVEQLALLIQRQESEAVAAAAGHLISADPEGTAAAVASEQITQEGEKRAEGAGPQKQASDAAAGATIGQPAQAGDAPAAAVGQPSGAQDCLDAERSAKCRRTDTDAGVEALKARQQLPILLFDLNGTLTSHTSQRRAAGTNLPRPHVGLLARLAKKFRLGIYTSSTVRTVAAAKQMLEEAAGCPLFEPRLVLYREHTLPAPALHCENGGKEWDTIKPLGKWFARLHRVLLFDDDSFKSVPGEEGNMVIVPAWGSSGREDPGCRIIEALVTAVEEELGNLDADADVRSAVCTIRAKLDATAQARTEELQQQQEGLARLKDPNAIDLDL